MSDNKIESMLTQAGVADHPIRSAIAEVVKQVLRADGESLPRAVREARGVLTFEAAKVIREASLE